MTKFDYKTSDYFPSAFRVAGASLLMVGFFVIFFQSFVAAAVLIISGAVIATTQYRFEIDPAGKVFREYVWILGMKNGAWTKYDHVEYIYIKKARVSETMSSRANITTIRKIVYEGYLKFAEEIKIHLGTDESKQALIKRFAVMAVGLGIKTVDYSEEA